MTTVATLPQAVRETEHLLITLADGCRLAARMWLPAEADQKPVPAILEYLPYRKRDGTTERDALTHPYLAAHGYACLRVDMRGNGESDGFMYDEYAKQEQDDALEVIAWIAAQPWCSGSVGIMGISWGGFNGLQIAARRPPALKAVVSICSTDDRYADDIHYMGGALLTENLGWASTMLAYSTRPPDPLLVGDDWRQIWLDRLDQQPFLAEPWLAHQRRDAYWEHGSICENYADITAATFLVGGWADGYSNTIFRMMEHLSCPKKALIGPWAHKYPHFAHPEPQVGFLQECLRWWDRYLKGADTGVENDPPLTLYMQDSARPDAYRESAPGRWITEPAWPSPHIAGQAWHLGQGTLGVEPQAPATLTVATPQTMGARCGSWCAFGCGPDHPYDQTPEDAQSVCLDTAPLSEPLELCGAPVLEVELTSDQPQGMLVARLCDVSPEGWSSRISWGVLNLTHRDSHAAPTPLEPGRTYRVRLRLNELAQAVPAGHRLRLAISNAYWPMLWPSPRAAKLAIDAGASRLTLPVRPARPEPEPVFAPAEGAAPMAQIYLRPSDLIVSEALVPGTNTVVCTRRDDYGERLFLDHGLRYGLCGDNEYHIAPDDPLSARMETRWTMTMSRGDWNVRSECFTAMWADARDFHMLGTIEAYENERMIRARSWNCRIPRDQV